MPSNKTRSNLSMRALALAQGLVLLVSLGVPMSALAALTAEGATVNGGATATVSPSATIAATVTGKITANNPDWRSTGWRIATTPGVITACADTPDQVGSGPSATVSFSMAAPASAGTYNAYFTLYSDNTCSTAAASSWTLPNAVVVAAPLVATTTTITSHTPDPSLVGAAISVGVSVVRASGSGTPGGSVTVTDGSATSAPCTLSGSGGTATATCSLTPTTSGAKTLTATYGGDAAFLASSSAGTGHTVIKAAQAPLVLTGTSSPAAYFDTQALGTTGGSGTGSVTYSTGASTACSVVGTTLTITASTGTCSVTATKAADANYLATSSTTADITVGKAVLVVTPDPQAVTFGDPVPVYTFAVTGFRNGENAGTAAGYTAPSCTSAYTPSTPVASSPLLVTCAGGAATNYTFNTSATAQLTIGASAQAPLVLTGTSSPATYGTTQSLGTTGGSGTGAVGYTSTTPAVCTISGGNTLTIVSGTGTCSVYATKAADAGYSAATSATVDITAAKAAPTCAITGTSVVYDGAPHGATGSCTGVAGETLAGLALGASFTDVPGGTAAWTFTDVTGNYADDSGSADVTIAKADTATVVTCGPGPFTYTGSAQAPCSASVTGPGGLDQALTVTYLDNTDAGTATADASFAGDGNHNPSADSATFEIARADAACTITGYTGTYDGAAHGASGSCLGVNDETLSGLDRGASFTNVPGGTAHWALSNANYNPSSGSVDIVITRADATCTITGYTGTYDGLAHGAHGSCTGVNDETLSGLDRGASFTDVPGGSAEWSLSNGNYHSDSGSVDIVITPADQSIVFPAIPNVTLGTSRVELEATTESGLPITYRSLTPAVCTVTGATVTVVGVGTCRVEASQAGDANHAPALPVTRSFDVAAADTSTPETSTTSPIDLMGGSGPLPPALLLGLMAVGVLGAVLLLFGFRARRESFRPRDAGR